MPPEPSSDPPPIRRDPARRVMLIACAVVLALLLIVVLINLDDPSTRVQDDLPPDVPELVPNRLASRTPGMSPDLRFESNTWIQVASGSGELAQQYRFDRMDPNPDGSYRMDRPVAQIFLSGGRVLELAGEEANVQAPTQALESGTLRGRVVIRLYEPVIDEPVRVESDRPALVVQTDEARFDNLTGIVRCDGTVTLQTNRAAMIGHGLRININESTGIAQWLEMPGEIRVRIAAMQPGERVGAAAPSPDAPDEATPSAGDLPVFYRLAFNDDVLIQQGAEESTRTIRGDVLRVIFSPRSTGLNSRLAFGSKPAPSRVSRVSWRLAMAAIPFAQTPSDRDSIAPPPAEDDIIVTCSNGITMRPVADEEWRPEDPRETVFELQGDPVELDDRAIETHASCSLLRYEAIKDHLELVGDAAHAVVLRSPDLDATGLMAWYRPGAGEAGLEGTGQLSLTRHPQPQDPDAPPLPGAPEQPIEQVRITWRDGVEMHFADDESGPTNRLESAMFRGAVDVVSDNLHLSSEEMLVGFNPDAQGDSEVRSIDARGNVDVRSLDEASPGRLRSGILGLTFVTTEDGKTAPATLTAGENVEASDEAQTIWASAVNVAFVPPTLVEATGEDAAVEPAADAPPPSLTDRLGGVEVADFNATGGVEVFLRKRGTRVFADQLQGDGQTREVVVTGENVRIFDGRHVFDRGRRLVLNEMEQVGHVDGPGQFRMFDREIIQKVDEDQDVKRMGQPPQIDEALEPSLRTRWNESAHFDGARNDGAGWIQFTGEVDAFVLRGAMEEQRMSGASLALDFALAAPAEGATDAQPQDAGTPAGTPAGTDDRRVARVVARGDAKLENTTWETTDHSDEPRVFYVAGAHVEFDDRADEALAVGRGTLLIHDPRPEPAPPNDAADDAAPPAEAPKVGLGGRGTTTFRWTDQLHLVPALDSYFDLEIRGDVEMIHRSITGETATLTCQLLEARVERPRNADDVGGSGSFDLGGHAELDRVQASGTVLVRTDAREVSCHVFDYKPRLGIAEILAGAGGRATVRQRNQARAARFDRAIWDMANDRFSITGVSGGGG